MFMRKKNRWILKAKSSSMPISMDSIDDQVSSHEIMDVLRESASIGELKGFISSEMESFIPLAYLHNQIKQDLSKGHIDIVNIIDKVQLPGQIIFLEINKIIKDSNGFFDKINRKYFTVKGAISEVTDLFLNKTYIDLVEILNTLYWDEDTLERILDIMVEKNLFRGYINPKTNRLYNLTNLLIPDGNDKYQSKEFSLIQNFIALNFEVYSELSLVTLKNLLQWDLKKTRNFLSDLREKRILSFVYSTQNDVIIPTLKLLNWILIDLIIYENIPIDFWVSRFMINKEDLIKFLAKFNIIVGGTIANDIFKDFNVLDWLSKGINFESLSKDFQVKFHEFITLINNLSKILSLRLVGGEKSDPFLVKAIDKYEIFCQVDTSVHKEPLIYYECQNCRRIICSNCRASSSKTSCPFCNNISDFIADLPRHCTTCNINYIHSFNLIDAEKCYFCDKLLEHGWIKLSKSEENTDLDFETKIKSIPDSEIPIRKIVSLNINKDKQAINILENLIVNNRIKGKIDVKSSLLKLEKVDTDSYICALDNESHTNTISFQCESCNTIICPDCYQNLKAVGLIMCPTCDSINSFQEENRLKKKL